MLVEEFLEQSARRAPAKVALVCGRERLTYRELDERANAAAHVLLRAGVERGDRVAIYLENSTAAVVAIFAALKVGGVFMVINPTTKPDKAAFILGDSRAAVIITDERRLVSVADRLQSLPSLRLAVTTGARREVDAPRHLAVETWSRVLADGVGASGPLEKRHIDVDLAALIYTSGSTGSPKGVMVTHLNVVTAATSITTYLENTSEDVVLSVLPLSFDYGLYQVLMAFKVGATCVLERSFTYPGAVMQKLVEERVTGFPIVPTISAILLQMDLGKFDLRHLRYITNTAAALPTRHITELHRLLPHVRLYSMYGLTECKRVAYLPPDQALARPTSVGKAIPNTEAYVVDETGRRVGAGIVGELVIRGAHVMRGYWERPEETARALRPGPLPGEQVLYSGDLFKTDSEGYLYFVGRKDDIIKTRGEKVSPREVENVLYALEGVAEAAVVGVPDPILGEAVKAVVAPANGARLTAEQVQRHCARHLEDFMVPRVIEIRDTLPRTSTGKISKRALRGGGEETA